ncbi:hypothetical protein AXFE_05000 [Acidithrix ferrooxidans]|uniref:Uncharacterized protein n=1 Tax=Acidithrix ferrooxidans TaxID=1280514 RepID=A0A0D8HLC0_9ACTN|nr:hypothetical protein AXFE_05000 [Acidithrix ferrooxidans]
MTLFIIPELTFTFLRQLSYLNKVPASNRCRHQAILKISNGTCKKLWQSAQ